MKKIILPLAVLASFALAQAIEETIPQKPKSLFFESVQQDDYIQTPKQQGAFRTVLNFVPPAGHFRSGQWRKGASDLWNGISLLWFIAEPNNTIKAWNDKITREEPTSRNYALFENNLKLYRHLQYCLFAMVFMNYINSVADCFYSENDDAFFGAFVAVQGIDHNSYIDRSWDDVPNRDFAYAPYGGLTFGYRGLFEFYAKMFFPNALSPITFCNLYSDYIIPFKIRDELDFYIGIGLVAGGYEKADAGTSYVGGLGSGPQIGCSYILQNRHYFRMTVIPYQIWSEVKCFEAIPEDSSFYSDNPRFSQQPFGDNFGAEIIYRYRLGSKFYAETLCQFSQLVEPGGEYIENGEEISIDRRTSSIIRLDLSINYEF